jgi:hypothetical protein
MTSWRMAVGHGIEFETVNVFTVEDKPRSVFNASVPTDIAGAMLKLAVDTLVREHNREQPRYHREDGS